MPPPKNVTYINFWRNFHTVFHKNAPTYGYIQTLALTTFSLSIHLRNTLLLWFDYSIWGVDEYINIDNWMSLLGIILGPRTKTKPLEWLLGKNYLLPLQILVFGELSNIYCLVRIWFNMCLWASLSMALDTCLVLPGYSQYHWTSAVSLVLIESIAQLPNNQWWELQFCWVPPQKKSPSHSDTYILTTPIP